MRCTEPRGGIQGILRLSTCLPWVLGLWLAGCAAPPRIPPTPVKPADRVAAPAHVQAPSVPVAAQPSGTVRLAPPGPVRSVHELRLQLARRVVAANPHLSYAGAPPEVLLAIPVLAIDLNADGSIHHIEVLRPPRQAQDTIQIAMDAVRRAAPFGDVSGLPRPWRVTETFLFNDDRLFKPRTLNTP